MSIHFLCKKNNKTRFSFNEVKTFIYEVNKKIAKQSSRSLGEAKTRFILPLGEIFIDKVNKGLRSNQTEVS